MMFDGNDPRRDPSDPIEQPAPAPTMLSGPITDPNDPRLTDQAYANDPNVLDWINRGLAAQQVAAGNGGTPNSPEWQPYIDAATPATVTPPPGGTTGGGGGGGGTATPPPGGTGPGGLVAPFTGTYTPPTPQGIGDPSSYLSTIPGAPAFPNIPRFAAPSIEEAMSDPGYKFVLDQGNQNLTNWAASRGTLNDSSEAKAFIDYGQGAASTQYGNVWNRAAQAYDRNIQSQYLDPFAAQYQTWMSGTVNPTLSNFQTQAANITNNNATANSNSWNSFLQSFRQFQDQRDSTFSKQYQVATS